MKRKFAMMVLVATMAASMMTGCGAKSDNAGAAQQEETTQKELQQRDSLKRHLLLPEH